MQVRKNLITVLGLGLFSISSSLIAQDMEEVTVTGSFIPDEKRDTSEISTVLDASEMERTGDDNIAIALTRLTGLSLVRGKYVYVRGLGERYSAATLNGSNLPSPEPLKRVVPLDLFPTNIIGSSVVQKTYSADMPGEFGGGIVEIESKAVPTERIFDMSYSIGYSNINEFDGITYDGGSHDHFGYDNGIRDIPQSIQSAITSNKKLDRSNFTPTDLANFGRDFENSKLWVIQEGDLVPNQSLNMIYGDTLEMDNNGAEAGFMFTAGMKSSSETLEGIRQTGTIQSDAGVVSIITQDDKQFISTTEDVTTYGMGVFGINTDYTEFKLTSLYIHKGTKEARSLSGFDSSDSADVREDFIEFYERELINNQINWSTILQNDIVIEARLADGSAERDSPYERVVFYEDGDADGVWAYDVNTGRNQTQFSIVEDDTSNIGIDVSIPFTLDNGAEIEAKIGFDQSENERQAEVRSFRFLAAGGPLPTELLDNRVDYIFADQNFHPNRLYVIENTGTSSPAGYIGQLETDAAYITFDAMLSDQIRLSAGIRNESGEQMINTYDLFSGVDSSIEKVIDEDYTLPAFTFTYLPEAYENLQIRLGLSQTIARPSFRELSPTLFIDVDTDRVIAGSLYLENSEIDNIDLRLEYYFGLNQFLTAGIFFKDIERPIEESVNESGDLIITTYQNVPAAEVKGIEFEYERIFENPLPNSTFFADKDLMIKVNYTYTDSEVKINPGDTYVNFTGSTVSAESLLANGRDTRLQGQSESIANFQVGFDSMDSQGTLIFNYVSDRIRSRGLDVLPDVIEEPPLLVDFVYSRFIPLDYADLKVSLELRNILNEEYVAKMADTAIYDMYEEGISVSLGFKLSF